MRVLLITEKLNKDDEVSSFFHGRLADFARECEELTVLVLENLNHSLPPSVKVRSMGKEKNMSRLGYIYNFYKYIFSHAGSYNRVFIHRSPMYVVMGGIFWRLLGKEVTLWYSHTYSDIWLRIAVLLSNHVISHSEDSFPFKTSKLKILKGHDLESYVCHLKEEK